MAQICIDVDRPVGRVDRRIFGGFIEHLGRCIYGGVFDEGSPLADARLPDRCPRCRPRLWRRPTSAGRAGTVNERVREHPANGDHVDIELAPHSLSVLEIGLA